MIPFAPTPSKDALSTLSPGWSPKALPPCPSQPLRGPCSTAPPTGNPESAAWSHVWEGVHTRLDALGDWAPSPAPVPYLQRQAAHSCVAQHPRQRPFTNNHPSHTPRATQQSIQLGYPATTDTGVGGRGSTHPEQGASRPQWQSGGKAPARRPPPEGPCKPPKHKRVHPFSTPSPSGMRIFFYVNQPTRVLGPGPDLNKLVPEEKRNCVYRTYKIRCQWAVP